ncbi:MULTISPECIES: DUF3618 domain-containing protein [Thermocrispum]|uniref:DUF3618 domain-containing protein n=1 Tax=Thermocrispum agreste TaxID=37925 RepID=A0A2W4IPX3_9PSEU|nr:MULTISPECIES: DUF3618 domain-containing protein [Thermocrispum]PZM88824.1 MAG: DUF3618 domain-containing protein [Thermocrispum agreste]
MVRDQEAIERDIERAREALAETLDQLGTKASPKRLAENAKSSVRATLDRPAVKYSLIAAGALMVLLVMRKLFRRG